MPSRDHFDVSLDGNHLCSTSKPAAPGIGDFFPHVTLKDVVNLPTPCQQHGFDNLDFELSPVMSLGVTRCCTAVRELSSYPIATIRTGQFEREEAKKHRQIG